LQHSKAMARDAAILGMTLFNATRDELREIHAGIVAGLENGTLNPAIGKELQLAEARKAHLAVMEAGAFGKNVLPLTLPTRPTPNSQRPKPSAKCPKPKAQSPQRRSVF
jgi:hypothetical protein